jgi:MFS family permease
MAAGPPTEKQNDENRRNGDTVVTERQPRANIIKVVAASMAGTAVEWYDFFLYGVAAAVVFPAVFFPSDDAAVGTLLALGTFAIGFVARPLGGLVFGHYGDKLGRNSQT